MTAATVAARSSTQQHKLLQTSFITMFVPNAAAGAAERQDPFAPGCLPHGQHTHPTLEKRAAAAAGSSRRQQSHHAHLPLGVNFSLITVGSSLRSSARSLSRYHLTFFRPQVARPTPSGDTMRQFSYCSSRQRARKDIHTQEREQTQAQQGPSERKEQTTTSASKLCWNCSADPLQKKDHTGASK